MPARYNQKEAQHRASTNHQLALRDRQQRVEYNDIPTHRYRKHDEQYQVGSRRKTQIRISAGPRTTTSTTAPTTTAGE